MYSISYTYISERYDILLITVIEYQTANVIISCISHNFWIYQAQSTIFYLDLYYLHDIYGRTLYELCAYWPQSTLFYLDLHDIFEPIGNPNWTYICFDNPQLQKLQRIETKHNITEPVSECINDGNDQSRHSRPEKLKMSSYQKTREMNQHHKKSYFEYFPWKWFTTKKGNIL